MKLSDKTISVLKNFASVNQGLLVKQGNTLKTISPTRTIFVEATVAETFPKEFALYDLSKLLAKVSLYKQPTLSFSDDRVVISTDDNKRSDYIKYCSQKVIVTPPDKQLNLGSVDCSFELSQEDLEWMRRSAGISGSPNFVFEGDGQKVYFIATDVKDDASDQSKIEIAATNATFKVVMKVENFKMMDGSYEVNISRRGMANFKHKTEPLSYFIAIEAANSTFGEG